ncbi:hypothetical protein [Kocuria turfanensis]|uniref:Uncharacterized protein n=1 Tax=Kocuria turfanensis TaxID=388357 RepID=A0A512IHI9_9MICC|nr:hypothetical protein [Kocuria turfanensis]GEO97108.1 hypothetical protein KTU01_32310 [Kocuria turfanensis]
MLDVLEAQQARRLYHTMDQAGLSVSQLWWHYFSLGGDTDEFEIEAYLHQALHLSSLDRLMLQHACYELTNDWTG